LPLAHVGHRNRADRAVADPPRGFPHPRFVKGHDWTTAVIVPTFEHEHLAVDAMREILRPVAEWRGSEAPTGGPIRTAATPSEIAALKDGIDEVRWIAGNANSQ
jgi:hypothetical protein